MVNTYLSLLATVALLQISMTR